MFSLLGIPLQVNPSVCKGLASLRSHLLAEGYPDGVIDRCLAYVAHKGTLGGLADLGWLRPSDEAAAEEAYVEGLDAVPAVSHRWLDEGVYTDADSYDEALQRALADTEEIPRQELPPIAGGAPRPSFSEWLDSQGGIAWEEGRD